MSVNNKLKEQVVEVVDLRRNIDCFNYEETNGVIKDVVNA